MRSVLASSLGSRHTEEIAWEELVRSSTTGSLVLLHDCDVIVEKKIEFMALEPRDMTVAEYHAKFLALERFMLSTFQTER